MAALGNITFDCADPHALSVFWAHVFNYPMPEWPPGLREELLAGGLTEEDLATRSVVMDPSGVGPRLFFQRVPEGKTAKNRMHVDVNSTPGRRPTEEELDAEAQRLIAVGATVVVKYDAMWGPVRDLHYVMQDPEGNEFCIQ